MLDKIFLEICNMNLIASYIILLVIIIRVALKRITLPNIFSYSLWSVVLFRLICPFSFESIFSIFTITGQIRNILVPFPNELARINDTTVIQGTNATTVITALERPVFKIIFPTVWFIGVSVILIYSMLQLLKIKRQLIGSTPLKSNIYLADHITSPFVLGLIKPKIYLPSSLSKAEQEFIIEHEKCHIRRLDHITRILAFIALTIHWFNPLVWFAFILSGKDMELSCDEYVMKKTGNDIRAEYSQALLQFATGKKLFTPTPLAFCEGDTKERVQNVMKYKKPVVWLSVMGLGLITFMLVGFMSNPTSEPLTSIDLPPAEILESNINSTDVTLAFEITDTDFIEQNELYATFQITGKVTKIIKGDFSSNDTIVFYKTIEGNENSKPYLSNEVFASFTLDENANLQIPDIGYDFSYSKELSKLVNNFKEG